MGAFLALMVARSPVFFAMGLAPRACILVKASSLVQGVDSLPFSQSRFSPMPAS
jgi:hypothetical protein